MEIQLTIQIIKRKKTKQDDKVSLMNVLKNALINNDNNTIEWALKQNNELIEATVIAMENEKELISTFISKLIELIQSNHFYDKNILVWIDTLFKFHFYLIMSLPQSTVNSLKNIKMLFENRTKYLHRLIEADAKFENFMSLLNTKKMSSKITATSMQPMLVYNESDSEEEKGIEKMQKKMKLKGITKSDGKKKKRWQRKKLRTMTRWLWMMTCLMIF